MRVRPGWQHGGLRLRPLRLQGEHHRGAVQEVGVRRARRTAAWLVLHLPGSCIPGSARTPVSPSQPGSDTEAQRWLCYAESWLCWPGRGENGLECCHLLAFSQVQAELL